MGVLSRFIGVGTLILSSCWWNQDSEYQNLRLSGVAPVVPKINSQNCPALLGLNCTPLIFTTAVGDSFRVALYEAEPTESIQYLMKGLTRGQKGKMIAFDNKIIAHLDSIHTQIHNQWLLELKKQLLHRSENKDLAEYLPQKGLKKQSLSVLKDTLWGGYLPAQYLCQSYIANEGEWQMCVSKNEIEKDSLEHWIKNISLNNDSNGYWKVEEGLVSLAEIHQGRIVAIGGNISLLELKNKIKEFILQNP